MLEEAHELVDKFSEKVGFYSAMSILFGTLLICVTNLYTNFSTTLPYFFDVLLVITFLAVLWFAYELVNIKKKELKLREKTIDSNNETELTRKNIETEMYKLWDRLMKWER